MNFSLFGKPLKNSSDFLLFRWQYFDAPGDILSAFEKFVSYIYTTVS